jgi:hypothetical protein
MAESLAPLAAPLEHAASADRRRQALVGGATFILLTAAAAAHGGYFPGSWGWLTLGCAWAAVLALALDARVGVTRTGAVFVGALAAYAVWSALSALWSIDVTTTMLEAQRNLVYVAAVGAALLLARDAFPAVLVGTWSAGVVVCGYALLTRIVPDRFGVVDAVSGYRLSEPVGYWNSLGMLAAVGVLLAVGLAAQSGLWLRAGAAATVPLFVTTLYFTFSRGAWAALFVGVVAVLALDSSRFRTAWWLLLGASSGALALLFATNEHALARINSTLSIQAADGHRLFVRLLIVGVLTGIATLGWSRIESAVAARGEPYRRRAHLAAVGVLVVAALAFFAVAGTPWHVADRAWHNFASAPAAPSANLNGRLFTFANHGRISQWRVAWHEAGGHPLAGTGAATFEHYWDLNRTAPSRVVNVHNLYLEAFATLGIVGLALLVTALTAPATAIVRLRSQPFVPFVAGVYAAYLAHAVVDWDWQITAVTLPVLVLAAALCAGGSEPSPRVRNALYGAVGLVALLAIWTIGAQHEQASIHDVSSARRASDLQPWSTDPWRVLAERDLASGRTAGARAAILKGLAKDSRDWVLWYDLARASTGASRAHALAQAHALNPLSLELEALRTGK